MLCQSPQIATNNFENRDIPKRTVQHSLTSYDAEQLYTSSGNGSYPVRSPSPSTSSPGLTERQSESHQEESVRSSREWKTYSSQEQCETIKANGMMPVHPSRQQMVEILDAGDTPSMALSSKED